MGALVTGVQTFALPICTPVHDHCGLSCVEGVWDGELEITQYELLDTDGDRARFRAAGGMVAGPGSAGSLIPPHEYHSIRNTSQDDSAVSVHIYKAPMEECRSEEHTSELKSLLRISYAAFVLKKKKKTHESTS